MDNDIFETGVIRKIIPPKLIGFILRDSCDGDLFFHRTGFINADDYEHLREGFKVQYQIGADAHGRDRAYNIQILEDGYLSDSKTGVINTLFKDKLFGFIKPDDGGQDLFFHRVALIYPKNFEDLEQGMQVTFLKETDLKGRPKAIGVVANQMTD